MLRRCGAARRFQLQRPSRFGRTYLRRSPTMKTTLSPALGLSRLSLWLLLPLLAAPAFSQPADLNQIVTVTLEDGKPASVTTRPLPQEAFGNDFVPPQKPE